MSDEEYVYDDDDDNGGDDAEMEDDARVELGNRFYEAEEARATDPVKSLALFEDVVRMEKALNDPSEVKWQWKALEQIVALRIKLNRDGVVEAFAELLTHMNRMTRNEVSETINTILDATQTSTSRNLDELYTIALQRIRQDGNERLWFSANLKRGKAFLFHGEYDKLETVIAELAASPAATTDVNKSTYMLEVYALEIAMYGATKATQKMRQAYAKTQSLGLAIQDPRIMGGIHESGGKMYMEEGRWQEAYDEFFHAFRSMQEAGDTRAKQVLKYVVLANVLALSKINPFDSREAKVYQSDEEIKTMLALRAAFENSEIREFEKLLASPAISGDAFVRKYMSSLLDNIRAEAICRLVKPYNRLTLAFLGSEVGVDETSVEALVVQLILDGKLAEARLDQHARVLDLGGSQPLVKRKYDALQGWAKALTKVTDNHNAKAVPTINPFATVGGLAYALEE